MSTVNPVETIELVGHSDEVASLRFAHDGTLLSCDVAGRIVRWSVQGSAIEAFRVGKGPGAEVLGLALHPDRRTGAWIDGERSVWVGLLGQPADAERMPLNRGSTWSVAWSPDGSLLAVGGEAPRLCLMRPASGDVQKLAVPARLGWVVEIAFSPDGRLLAFVGLSGSGVWDLEAGGLRFRHPLGSGGGCDVRFSGDDRVYFRSARQLVAYSARTGERDPGFRWRGRGEIEGFDTSPDGRLLGVVSEGIDTLCFSLISGVTGRVVERRPIPPSLEEFWSGTFAVASDGRTADSAGTRIFIRAAGRSSRTGRRRKG